MSELATAAALPPESGPPENPTPGAPARGLVALAISDAVRFLSVKLCLAWLVLVATLAVFAPVLANSRPILMKADGRWSSPLLNGLQWSDLFVFLSASGAIVVLRYVRVLSVAWRFFTVGLLMLVVGTLCYLSLGHRADDVVVYSSWREMADAGKIEWALHSPIPYSPDDYLRDEFKIDDPYPWSPRRVHWLGTDTFGADITSRMIHACRIALSVGLVAEGVALIVGVIIGALMGYFGKTVDLLGMRGIEIFSSIPQFYLLLTCVAFFSRNLYLIMLIIGLTSWPGYAVFIRAQFLSLRSQDFVQAAKAAGLPTWRIVFLHMLPNGVAPVLVSATFGIASAITAEAGLSFLGIGPVDVASWGALLNQALNASRFYWWLGVFPGTAIFLTVLSYNIIGDKLRDALDPRGRKRE